MNLVNEMERPPKYNLPEQVDPERPLPESQDEPTGGLGLLAQVSTLAWNLVIPIVGGVMLGYYIDNRNNGGLTWTLSLLVLGVLIAFSNLYNLYVEQGRQNLNQTKHSEKHEENDDQET